MAPSIMSALVRRSLILKSHLRVVSPLVTKQHQSSFCCPSFYVPQQMPIHFYEECDASCINYARKYIDELLLKKLEVKIRHAADVTEKLKEEGGLLDFPFEVINNPGERRIILKRNISDGCIEILVDIVDDEDCQRRKMLCCDRFDGISLRVTANKRDASPPLELCCTAHPDNSITIDSVVVKKPGKSSDQNGYDSVNFFRELEKEHVKEHILKYLERIGIDTSLVNSLHEYMMRKALREHLLWLENLQDFIKN